MTSTTKNLLRPGLVSVTFRSLSPAEIIEIVRQAGLEGIEWGGDIHVPHGDIERARSVRNLTREAGLEVAAYGSYYRAGCSEEQGLAFRSVLDTAHELGAPLIRVWAGAQSPAKSDDSYRKAVAADLQRIAEMSLEHGISIGLEYHVGTLTETADSTEELLHKAAHPNVRTLWQPAYGANETADTVVENNVRDLGRLLPQVANLHVYNWRPDASGAGVRLPLSEGESAWNSYLQVVAEAQQERWALLEFVRDDSPQAFLEDAQTLKHWLQN